MRDAFEESYERYHPSVFGYIYSRTGTITVAEELTAEVFARLVDRLDTIRDCGRPLRAWLHVVAHNLVIDYLRRARRLQWLPLDDHLEAEDSAYPPQIAERRFQCDSLFASFRYLTEAQRQVITLKYLEGYSNAEVGAILGKDENSVKSLQHRALVTLRRVLAIEQFVSS